LVEEVLRALAPRAVRPGGEIRAVLQRDKGVSLAYTSIRHALGQLEGRKAVQQDGNGGWRIAPEATSRRSWRARLREERR
jgi:DNA-binding GntR family transcriptional regulator